MSAGGDTMNQPATGQLGSMQSEREVPFQFSGAGGEFFRIWIVNLFLTIVTLGIYSAWAKVRTANYFYGNTHLDGNSFRYLAKPMTILKGRAIALVVLLLYVLVSELYPAFAGLFGLAFLVAMPWLITRSLRFNAVNSAYRNVRFNFTGSYGEAASAFILWPMAAVLTAGILFPVALKKQHEFVVNNHQYGTAGFDLDCSAGDFFKAVFAAVGIGVVVVIAGSLLSFLGEWAGFVAVALAYLAAFAFYRAQVFNIVYGGTRIGDHRLQASMTPGGFLALVLGNALLVVLTLGLAYPLVRIRTARFKAAHLNAVIAGSLDNFVAGETEKVGALGEQLGEMMDLDIGL
jgi:uncharacterized membrane protein YjgN (DUF898 family)